jgi:hypothetical protein
LRTGNLQGAASVAAQAYFMKARTELRLAFPGPLLRLCGADDKKRCGDYHTYQADLLHQEFPFI